MDDANKSEEKPSQESSPAEAERVRRDKVGEDVALTRLLVIGPLLDTGLDRLTRAKVAREIAARGWNHPVLGPRGLSLRTLNRWLEAWGAEKLDGLLPSHRADRGEPRALTPELFAIACELKREVPGRSVRQVIELLEVVRGVVEPGTLARSTLQRHLQRLGLSGRRGRAEEEAARRFAGPIA